jgi:hypothetical protein
MAQHEYRYNSVVTSDGQRSHIGTCSCGARCEDVDVHVVRQFSESHYTQPKTGAEREQRGAGPRNGAE